MTASDCLDCELTVRSNANDRTLSEKINEALVIYDHFLNTGFLNEENLNPLALARNFPRNVSKLTSKRHLSDTIIDLGTA